MIGFTRTNSESTTDAALFSAVAKLGYLRRVSGKNAPFMAPIAEIGYLNCDKSGNRVVVAGLNPAACRHD